MPKKVFILSLVLGLVLVDSAYAITGIRSMNNEVKDIDYKTEREQLEELSEIIMTYSQDDEIIYSTPERDLSGLIAGTRVIEESSGEHLIPDSMFSELTSPISEKELSWLIENNIVSREDKITVGPDSVIVNRDSHLIDLDNPLDTLDKTDFLMGIYKSIYGVIESRPLLIKVNAWRNAAEQYVYYEDRDGDGEPERYVTYINQGMQRVSGTGKVYRYYREGETTYTYGTFPEGDYYVYVSPNVPELYIKELLDKNIISLGELNSVSLRTALTQVGTLRGNSRVYPRWYNDITPYMVNGGRTQRDESVYFISGTKPLGSSYDITGVGNSDRGSAGNTVEIVKNNMTYFIDESISAIDALKYIEALLRLTEKDMTDTEATIVSYKYGANYLSLFEDSDRKTIMFLTAKGILNFEDPTEYRNLYGPLTKEFGYKLMYRVSNKNARLDFSAIQLTDSDNFWIERGFSQKLVGFSFLDQASFSSFISSDGNMVFSPVPDVVTENVTLDRRQANAVTFSEGLFGASIFSGKSTLSDTDDSYYLVTKVFDSPHKYKYKNVRLTSPSLMNFPEVDEIEDMSGRLKVVFRVKARTPSYALSAVDSHIQVGTEHLFNTQRITGVTKFDYNGEEVILIPAGAFESGDKILILEDKVLKNTQTGTTAVLLPEKNMALVGTHIITSEEIMVEQFNGEVYYNLDIIKTLLSEAYFSSLYPDRLYFMGGLLEEKLVNVVSSSGNVVEKTYVIQQKVPSEGGDPTNPNNMEVTTGFVNISNLTRSGNFMVKEYRHRNANNEVVNFYVIMHLVYRLPDKNMDFVDPIYGSSNPDLEEINNFIYHKSEDPELADWWENNIEISNAFANTFYGTRGVQYIKSGYLVPNITVLYDNHDVIQQKMLSDVFKEVGSHLSREWVLKFIGKWEGYNDLVEGNRGTYHYDPNNSGSVYYPDKALAADFFPKWVHIMYNNSSYSPDTIIDSGIEKKNTNTWRFLMADRNLHYSASRTTSSGVRLFTGDGPIWALTSGGSIYRRISPNDPKFPANLVAGGKVVLDNVDWEGKSKFEVHLITRTEVNDNSYWVGRNVTDHLGINTFRVVSLSDNKIEISDTVPVIGTPVQSKRGDRDFYDIRGSVRYANGSFSAVIDEAIRNRYMVLEALFSKENLVGYEGTLASFSTAGRVTRMPSYDVARGKTIFVDNGEEIIDPETTNLYYTVDNHSHWKTYNQTMNETVHAYVSLQLDANYWYISDDGRLMPRKTYSYFQVGNIYLSGINQSVIDSILEEHIGVISVSELTSGDRLHVGDLVFTKVGNRFVSDPVNPSVMEQSLLLDANNTSLVESSVTKMFTGMSILNGQINTPLVSYLSNPRLDTPVGTFEDERFLGGGTLTGIAYVHQYSDSILESKEYDKTDIPIVDGIVFSVEIHPDLNVRLVDPRARTYQLMLSTSVNAEGYLKNVPFFGESLSLDRTQDLFLSGSKSSFKFVPRASELKDEFVRSYNEMLDGDLVSLGRVVGIAILSFIILISWLCYAILRFGVFNWILELLRNPSRDSDRRGIDIIKIISFGMYNMDSRPSALKLAISNIAMFCMIYVLLGVF